MLNVCNEYAMMTFSYVFTIIFTSLGYPPFSSPCASSASLALAWPKMFLGWTPGISLSLSLYWNKSLEKSSGAVKINVLVSCGFVIAKIFMHPTCPTGSNHLTKSTKNHWVTNRTTLAYLIYLSPLKFRMPKWASPISHQSVGDRP